ncbi:MAG: glutamate-cysteine ligase family protein [Myxococcota bacterium]
MSLDFESDAPPIESLDELVDWFAKGEKSGSLGVGVEHEKLPFRLEDGAPVDYDSGIGPFLRSMSRFGWEPPEGDGPAVMLKRGDESITLEPGGQVELASGVRENLHDAADDLHHHVRESNEVAAEHGFAFAWLGLRPGELADKMPGVPKPRYQHMASYLPTKGRRALDMMFLSATVQANFDYVSESDMSEMMRVSMAISPTVSSIFCNSPYRNGEWHGYRSSRYAAWREVDPERCGLLHFVFDDDMGYRRYLEYALDVPMLFYRRKGRFVELKKPFREFLEQGHNGERPNLGDFETHLSLMFPEVRLKQFIEVRSVDCVPPSLALASVALWKGVLYDSTARAQCMELFAPYRGAALDAIQFTVAQDGLSAHTTNYHALELARELVQIAEGGLDRIASEGRAERSLLEPVKELLSSGKTLADRRITQFGGRLDHQSIHELLMSSRA